MSIQVVEEYYPHPPIPPRFQNAEVKPYHDGRRRKHRRALKYPFARLNDSDRKRLFWQGR